MTLKTFVFAAHPTFNERSMLGLFAIEAEFNALRDLYEGASWVLRARDSNVLPPRFSSLSLQNRDIELLVVDQNFGWFSRAVEAVAKQNLCLVDRIELHKNSRATEVCPSVRYYIDGRFAVHCVCQNGNLVTSRLMSFGDFHCDGPVQLVTDAARAFSQSDSS